MSGPLDQLYSEAKSALKDRDYDRASELLRQILLIDENYRDASRLLAQAVKLKRRRWYSHPLLWGALSLVIVLALGFFIAPRLKVFSLDSPTQPVATNSPTVMLAPTMAVPLTETPVPTATPIPLTWKRISVGQEFSRDKVTAIVVDPKDEDIIYVGLQNAGIYKSINGGNSWGPIQNGLDSAGINLIVINPGNPSTLYTLLESGNIYRTEDGGEHWNVISDKIYQALVMDPTDSQHLFSFDGQIWNESEDEGTTWRPINTVPTCPEQVESAVVDPNEPDVFWAIGGGSSCRWGLYKSVDGGKSWVSIFLDDLVHMVELDKQTGDYVYLLVDFEVLLSTDGGNSWRRPWWEYAAPCLTFAIDPQDSKSIYCGLGFDHGLFEVWKSTDIKGGIFQRLTHTQTNVGEITKIEILPSNGSIVVGGQGLTVLSEEGETWITRNNGLGGHFIELEIDPTDSSILYVSEGKGTQPFVSEGKGWRHDTVCPLFKSTDQGFNWSSITDFESISACGFSLDASGDKLYRSDGDAAVIISDNEGESWRKAPFPVREFQVAGLTADPQESGKLIAYSYHFGSMYTSTNAGYSWQKANSQISGDFYNFIFEWEAAQIVFAVGNEFIYQSEDGGQSWNKCQQTAFEPARSDSAMAINSINKNIYLATRGGGILASQDRCQSWEAINNGLDDLYVNTLALNLNNPNTVYAGTDGGAYISFDGGQTWGQINDGLLGATVVYSIAVDKDGNVFAATPYGIFKLEGK